MGELMNLGGSSMDGAPALFSTEDGKYNSGHHLGGPKDSKVVFFAELINNTTKTLEVYSVTDIDYIPGDPAGIMDSSVGIVSVNECDGGIPDPALPVPAGETIFSVKSKPMTITESGYMVCAVSNNGRALTQTDPATRPHARWWQQSGHAHQREVGVQFDRNLQQRYFGKDGRLCRTHKGYARR
jgi:hypothetical protein